jgi:hypothetical protein
LQFCERALKKGRSSEKPDTLRKKNGSWNKSYFYFRWSNGSCKSSTSVPNAARTMTKYIRQNRNKQCATECLMFVMTVQVVSNASCVLNEQFPIQ